MVVGLDAVKLKVKKLSRFSKSERLDYLRRHAIPVVVGPDQQLYMIDHHHLSLALIKSGHQRAFVERIADWSKLSVEEFWEQMQSHQYTYLADAEGHPVPPSLLPTSVTDLQDDTYRSLAYFVREKDGFDNTPKPFAEFAWANFFRTKITYKRLSHHWNSSIREALRLSKTKAAQGLPGFNGPNRCSLLFSEDE